MILAIGLAALTFAAPAPIRPNPTLTPGAVLTTRTTDICAPGWSAAHRHVTAAERHAAFAEYGIPYTLHRAYELDHLVSLELGGSNALANLWPERHADPWGSYTKDRLENRLHALVCSGAVPIRVAQRAEARNWIAAYQLWMG